MKYIRTKEGRIYELDHISGLGICYVKRKGYGVYDLSIRDSANIKQADTIDELCDEFVWVTPEGEHHIKPKTGDGLWYLCCDYKKGHQIYGAIWTDKGLIYVAKMNEKGELELL